jgi:hypothetical protein
MFQHRDGALHDGAKMLGWQGAIGNLAREDRGSATSNHLKRRNQQ